MEFRYRAGDERSLFPPPSTGAAAALANSGSAATGVQDGHGGDGTGPHRKNSAVVPRTPRPAAAPDPDELRRQAAKERIRERILREEAETLALEAEVRRELMDALVPLLRPRLAGAYAEGLQGMAEQAGVMADSTSPIILESMHARSKENGSAALAAKRTNPDVAAASTFSAATSSKKQKPDLICTVCSITVTGETVMQDHLKGKSHRRKAAALAQPMPKAEVRSKAYGSAALPAKGENPGVPAASTVLAATSCKKQKLGLTCTFCSVTSTGEKAMQDHLKGKSHRRKAAAAVVAQPMPEAEEHEREEEEEYVVTTPEGGYTPTKLVMLTNAGTMNEVVQMDGFLLCEVCNVRTADRVTMMCHLEGSKHTSKPQQEQRQGGRPPAVDAATATKKSGKRRHATPVGGDPGAVVVEVNRVDGFLHTNKARTKDAAVATKVDIPGAPGHEVKRVGAPAAVGDFESVVVDAGGVQHVVHKVDGFLLCACCGVKAPSDCVMRSHLAGKKHKDKAKVAAVHVRAGGKEAVLNKDEAKSKEASAGMGHHTQGNDSIKGQAAGEHAEVGDATAVAEEESAAAELVNSAATQGKVSVKTDGVAAAPALEVKIQVEGKMCTVLRQADGGLSCGLCGVHGCDKEGMLQHLYTRAHWDNACLAEKKAEQAAAAPALVSNDGDA